MIAEDKAEGTDGARSCERGRSVRALLPIVGGLRAVWKWHGRPACGLGQFPDMGKTPMPPRMTDHRQMRPAWTGDSPAGDWFPAPAQSLCEQPAAPLSGIPPHRVARLLPKAPAAKS